MCVYLYLFRSKNSFQLIGELRFFFVFIQNKRYNKDDQARRC